MASAKGGSGKTILTATFGTFLAALGKRVLVVDTDAATNGLSLLYLKEVRMRGELALSQGRQPRGIYELTGPADEPDVVTLNTGVDLIPATYAFTNTEDRPVSWYGLSYCIPRLRESYDYIFLDAQPGSAPGAQAGMRRDVSDEVVIVSEYDPMSAAGVERLKALFREDLTYPRTWVLLNKMLPDFVKSFSDFLEVAKYLSPIPWDADVVRAYARRKIALNLADGNEHTLAVMQTLKSLLGEEISDTIQRWAKDKESAIRKPIASQIKDLEAQLESVLTDRRSLEERISRRRFASLGLLLASCGLVFSAAALSIEQLRGSLQKLITREGLLVALGSLAALFATSALLLRLLRIVPKGGTEEIKRARLRREEAILESRLTRLQALQAADLETLIKSPKT